MQDLTQTQLDEAHKIYVDICKRITDIRNIEATYGQQMQLSAFVLGNMQGWVLTNILDEKTKSDDQVFKDLIEIIQACARSSFLEHRKKNDVVS